MALPTRLQPQRTDHHCDGSSDLRGGQRPPRLRGQPQICRLHRKLALHEILARQSGDQGQQQAHGGTFHALGQFFAPGLGQKTAFTMGPYRPQRGQPQGVARPSQHPVHGTVYSKTWLHRVQQRGQKEQRPTGLEGHNPHQPAGGQPSGQGQLKHQQAGRNPPPMGVGKCLQKCPQPQHLRGKQQVQRHLFQKQRAAGLGQPDCPGGKQHTAQQRSGDGMQQAVKQRSKQAQQRPQHQLRPKKAKDQHHPRRRRRCVGGPGIGGHNPLALGLVPPGGYIWLHTAPSFCKRYSPWALAPTLAAMMSVSKENAPVSAQSMVLNR